MKNTKNDENPVAVYTLEIIKDNGITLIVLVITIIVLLMLAGVSIAMLIGNNGILAQAQKAKQATEQANIEEKLKLAIISTKSDEGKLKISKFLKEIKEYGITYENTEKFPVTITENNNKYIITEKGNIINDNLIKYTKDGLMVYLDGNHNTCDNNTKNTSIWYDLSGHENNAILNNFKFDKTSGWIENGLKFHGNTESDINSNEEVIIPYSLKENESFSVELVFQWNTEKRITFLSANTKWNTFRFHNWVNENNVYDGRFYIGENDYAGDRFTPYDTSEYLLKKDKTQYISYTYNSDNNTATLYVNGIKNCYSKKYKNKNGACDFFEIRALDEYGICSASVIYNQIRFYNKELSKEEVENNFKIDNIKYNISE